MTFSISAIFSSLTVFTNFITGHAKKRKEICALLDQAVFSKVRPMFTQVGILESYLPKVDKAYREIFKKALVFKEQSHRYFQANYNAYDDLKGFGGSNWCGDELDKNRSEFRKIAQNYMNDAEDFIQNELFKTYGSIGALRFKDKKIKKLEEIIQAISQRYDLSNFKPN